MLTLTAEVGQRDAYPAVAPRRFGATTRRGIIADAAVLVLVAAIVIVRRGETVRERATAEEVEAIRFGDFDKALRVLREVKHEADPILS